MAEVRILRLSKKRRPEKDAASRVAHPVEE
jgi:hypothetical protein